MFISMLVGDSQDTITGILTRALEERNWSYRELAERAGLSTATVGTHVLGQKVPGPASLRKYARALGLPANRLLIIAGHAEPSRDSRPLELDALHERLDEVWGELSRESQINLSRYILGLESYRPPSESR